MTHFLKQRRATRSTFSWTSSALNLSVTFLNLPRQICITNTWKQYHFSEYHSCYYFQLHCTVLIVSHQFTNLPTFNTLRNVSILGPLECLNSKHPLKYRRLSHNLCKDHTGWCTCLVANQPAHSVLSGSILLSLTIKLYSITYNIYIFYMLVRTILTYRVQYDTYCGVQ